MIDGVIAELQRGRAELLMNQQAPIVMFELSPSDGVVGLAGAIEARLKSRGESPELINLSAPVSRLSHQASSFILHGTLTLVRQRRVRALKQYRAQVHQALEERGARVFVLCDVDMARIREHPVDGSDLLLDARSVRISAELRNEAARHLRQAASNASLSPIQRLCVETGLLGLADHEPMGPNWIKRLVWDGVDALSPDAVTELDQLMERIETYEPVAASLGMESLGRILTAYHSHDPEQFASLVPFVRNLCNSTLELTADAQRLFTEIGRTERAVRRAAVVLSFVGTTAKVSWPSQDDGQEFTKTMPDLAKLTLAEAVFICRHIASQHPGATQIGATLERVLKEVVPTRNEILHFRSMRPIGHELRKVVEIREDLERRVDEILAAAGSASKV